MGSGKTYRQTFMPFSLRKIKRVKRCRRCSTRFKVTGNRHYHCKACQQAYQREMGEKYRRDGRYREKPYITIKAKRARYKHVKKLYNLTPVAYDDLMTQAVWACQICYTNSSFLCIDHIHATGEVRGILCKPCNLAIGLLRDDPDILANAIDYLKKQGLHTP